MLHGRALRLVRNVAFLSLLVACGSRTGLFGDEDEPFDTGDGGVLPGTDGGERDARTDAYVDRNVPPDAIPPIDAKPPRDANRTDCLDASQTLIYVISADNELFSFDPTTSAVKGIGRISCPTTSSGTPFSMAVDRKGIAYIVFNGGADTGKLFRVSTATAACIGTSFVPRQAGYGVFGMGFATDLVGTGETLYVAGSDLGGSGREGFARIAIPSFQLTHIGDFFPVIKRAELTGTGDGRLYGFYSKDDDDRTFIGEIDTTNGRIVGENRLDGVTLGGAWAFAAWGGDFYTFTAPAGQSVVTRYRPSDGSTRVVATIANRIVGAGVSTCAPSE